MKLNLKMTFKTFELKSNISNNGNCIQTIVNFNMFEKIISGDHRKKFGCPTMKK